MIVILTATEYSADHKVFFLTLLSFLHFFLGSHNLCLRGRISLRLTLGLPFMCICDAFRHLVPFVQFKKREKCP